MQAYLHLEWLSRSWFGLFLEIVLSCPTSEPETPFTRDTIQAAMSRMKTPQQFLESARALAVASHSEQLYADEPYERHLEEVVRVLVSNGADPNIPAHLDVLCAAWLHDTLEDTDLDPAIIGAEFGAKVLEIVHAVTD
jgi:(p)ppGpp synthase/HD superfamily hydrolase